jgi:hypothetical protein
MSAGTFSLMPGPASVAQDVANFAGTVTPGTVTGFTSVTAPSVYADVATRVRECSIPVVQDAYMRAARDFTRRTLWLRRNIPVVAATPNVAVYNFGADPNLEVVDVAAAQVQQMSPSNTWVGLRPTGQDTYDPNMAADIPNWYSYLPEGMIVYYPTPNLAYNLKVELTVVVLNGSNNLPNDLLTRWSLYIEAGARMHLYLMDKEPWANPTLAGQAKDEYFDGISVARAMVTRSQQKGPLRATPRPFISR